MLSTKSTLPNFSLTAVASANSENAFQTLTQDSFPEKWKVLFFWPKDFTFVCPTEIIGFGNIEKALSARNTQLIGASTDSEYVHLAWRNDHSQLKNSPFPWLSDIKKELSTAMGILDEDEGIARRATFIIDDKNKIRYASMVDEKVGRNPKEVLRILDALQSEGLCACEWQAGDQHIVVTP